MTNFLLFIRVSDILLSILFNLLLAIVTILSCFFFLFDFVFNDLFTISEVMENAKLKLALATLTGASIIVADDATDISPLVADEKIYNLSKYSKEAIYLLINSIFLMSAIK